MSEDSVAAKPVRKTRTNAADSDENKSLVFESAKEAHERETLFTIDGVDYTVPKKPGMNVTLKFMNEYRKSGNEMFAALGLLESLLGPAKYAELLEWEDLTDDVFGKILEQATVIAMGDTSKASGK